jgi:hypothetical protein
MNKLNISIQQGFINQVSDRLFKPRVAGDSPEVNKKGLLGTDLPRSQYHAINSTAYASGKWMVKTIPQLPNVFAMNLGEKILDPYLGAFGIDKSLPRSLVFIAGRNKSANRYLQRMFYRLLKYAGFLVKRNEEGALVSVTRGKPNWVAYWRCALLLITRSQAYLV